MKRFIIFCFSPVSAFAYEAFQGPTETIYWNTNLHGQRLHVVRHSRDHLPDWTCKGTWSTHGRSGRIRIYLATAACSMRCRTRASSGFGSFVQVSWSGSNLWQYSETRMNYLPHHDFLRIYNPKLAPRFSVNDPSRWVITLQERGLVAGVFAAVVG